VADPSPLRHALANREIRLAELAWMLAIASENAYLVALFVNAYLLGGIVEVGLAGVARALPGGLLAPFIAGLGDRLPRHRLLLGVHVARAVLVGALAIVAATGGNLAILLGLAALEGIVATLHRPSQMSLLPALATAPDELVASNVISGAAENLGSLAGPAAGAALVAFSGVPLALAVPAVGFGAAAVTIGLVRPASQPRPAADRLGRRWHRGLDGLLALRDHPSARLIVGLGITQTFVRGAMVVLLVAASAEQLGIGEQGYGLLQAAIGFGGLAGAIVIGALAGSLRLSTATLVGLALWGLPIAAIGVVPVAPVAIVVLVILGMGNATFDVGIFSLLQRNVPNQVRAGVLGAFEGLISLTVALGSLVAPVLGRTLGLRGALVVIGLILPLTALAATRAVRRTEEQGVIPERELKLLRGVSIFRSLPMTVIEQLAVSLEPEKFQPGEDVCVQGEAGDRFFVISEGRASVLTGGKVVRELGAGDSFGEIALLHEVPRTATVRADGELLAYALARDDFVYAVTGNPNAAQEAESVIGTRLRDDATRA
jgi:MFS family permease